ncbi:hypothetical protein E3P96_01660 [Wallemia ichthyophaga]|nr:hypothetical protein E3P96_01660 [Wallemia ichthyophaga]
MASDPQIKNSNVDVLIIGAGPAGVIAADWLARFTKYGVKTRVVDKRSHKVFTGQADGLNPRSIEMFQSFNIANKIVSEANPMNEVCFWAPNESHGGIERGRRIPDTIPGISRYVQSVLHQGRIERHILDDMNEKSNGTMKIERGVLPETLEINEELCQDDNAYPVKVGIRQLSEEESRPKLGSKNGEVESGLYKSNLVKDEEDDVEFKPDVPVGDREIINAKYVIGADGAHSWVRRQLGFKMQGEGSDFVWGVVDGVPITNFPDIRCRAAIHSNAGSMMIIPREGSLVRLYIQLNLQVDEGGHVDRSLITPKMLMDQAKAVFHPYSIEIPDIMWYTGYQVGQRLTSEYAKNDRVFIAGDACHTHSPKAGQGMNASMADTYNLCWKIGHVLAGHAPRSILKTYESERRPFAEHLIMNDAQLAKLFSGKPLSSAELNELGVDMKDFENILERGISFFLGTSIEYFNSTATANGRDGRLSSKQELAKNIPVGQRFPSHQVVSQFDGRHYHLVDTMFADGQFTIVLFAGNMDKQVNRQRLQTIAQRLDSDDGVVSKYTPKDRQRDGVIDVKTVHCGGRTNIEVHEFPQPTIYPPGTYNKLYVDDVSYHAGHGEAYKNYDISKEDGAVVVVRPDHFVGLVTSLDGAGMDDVDKYFSGLLKTVPAEQRNSAKDIKVIPQPKV